MSDLRGFTLSELFTDMGSHHAALDWLCVELSAGRVRRYWRGQGEALAVYRRVG